MVAPPDAGANALLHIAPSGPLDRQQRLLHIFEPGLGHAAKCDVRTQPASCMDMGAQTLAPPDHSSFTSSS